MDSIAAGVDLVAVTRSLVDIDSTTGREGEAGRWLAQYSARSGSRSPSRGWTTTRFNVLASCGEPAQVVFSTHFDCVPPFFPSRVEGGRLYGRGACDAKGILAAQIAAAERLRRQGERRAGLLFVVGEERGSDGAQVANSDRVRLQVSDQRRADRQPARTCHARRVSPSAARRGRAAHSSFPELGESAIDKLIDALVELRAIELPTDSVLGKTHYTIGLINGGIAPNVVSPLAEAEVMFHARRRRGGNPPRGPPARAPRAGSRKSWKCRWSGW